MSSLSVPQGPERWKLFDARLLDRVLPAHILNQVAARWTPTKARQRALPTIVVIWWCLAMHLYPRQSLANVWRTLTQSRRLSLPQDAHLSDAAISQARQRVGARPLVDLFHTLARPVATREEHPSAFCQQYRLVALDGTYENVADTPGLAKWFGRQSGQ